MRGIRACRGISEKPPSSNECARIFPTRTLPSYMSKRICGESFRKKLKNCLSHFCTRKGWKYVGVWERSPEKKRLHFHGIFHIPDGTMPGMMLEVADYNFKAHRRVVTHQNSYFNEEFGRSDFEPLDIQSIGSAI